MPAFALEPSQLGAGSATVPPAPVSLNEDGQEIGRRVASRAGEICLVCGKPITTDDVTYQVNGQRVPVHQGKCLDAFAARPLAWLSKLRPRGAFLDAGAAQLGHSSFWLILGTYTLVGLIFSALAAQRAFNAGRNPLIWLVIGFLASIAGFAVLLALPKRAINAPAGVPAGLSKVAATYSPETCPACGAGNHPSARVCSGCGATLAPQVESEVQKAGLSTR